MGESSSRPSLTQSVSPARQRRHPQWAGLLTSMNAIKIIPLQACSETNPTQTIPLRCAQRSRIAFQVIPDSVKLTKLKGDNLGVGLALTSSNKGASPSRVRWTVDIAGWTPRTVLSWRRTERCLVGLWVFEN